MVTVFVTTTMAAESIACVTIENNLDRHTPYVWLIG